MDGNIQLHGNWGGAPPIDSVFDDLGQLGNCTVKVTVQYNSNTTEYHYNACQDQQQYKLTVLTDWGHDLAAQSIIKQRHSC